MAPTTNELVLLLFPVLTCLETVSKKLGSEASLSVRAATFVLRHLAKSVIQDAVAGLSKLFSTHPVHMLLQTSAVCR